MELLGHYDTVTWMVIFGSFFSFGVGWATGSNDVANAFATSVGSKTLNLKQAVMIASVFEFVGCVVLGRVTTSVIAGGITNTSFYQSQPEVYAYGMMWALLATALWNTFGSYMEYNVSTTHSIVGSIIGFSLVYGGKSAVNWAAPDHGSFPPYKGLVPIICSWFISPILTAIAAALLFMAIRYLVLKRKNSYQLSFYLLPLFVALTVWLCVYFTLYKGAKNYLKAQHHDLSHYESLWIAAVVAGGCALFALVVVLPILRKRAEAAMARRTVDEEQQAKGTYIQPVSAVDSMKPWAECNPWQKVVYVMTYGTKVNIHDAVEEDPAVAVIHARAEQFDPKTEFAFSYLQVFSAICVMFAHGANDSGYAIGPLAGIYAVYKTGTLPTNVNPPIWIVIMVAASMVIGLATYGYNVTRAMGTRMAKLSASRGFSAELATATVILVTSQYGLPTSSSQCITGAIIGIGACEGLAGVNWWVALKQFGSWVATLFVCGFFTAALFAQGVYAPSKEAGRQVEAYETWIVNMTRTQLKDFNTTLHARPPGADFNTFVKSLDLMDKTTKNYLKYNTIGTLQPKYVLPAADNMLSIIKNFTVYTIALDKAKLNALCLTEVGVACAQPKLLDAKYAIEQPLTKPIPGTASVLALK